MPKHKKNKNKNKMPKNPRKQWNLALREWG